MAARRLGGGEKSEVSGGPFARPSIGDSLLRNYFDIYLTHTHRHRHTQTQTQTHTHTPDWSVVEGDFGSLDAEQSRVALMVRSRTPALQQQGVFFKLGNTSRPRLQRGLGRSTSARRPKRRGTTLLAGGVLIRAAALYSSPLGPRSSHVAPPPRGAASARFGDTVGSPAMGVASEPGGRAIWRVVGGTVNGGIRVRTGKAFATQKYVPTPRRSFGGFECFLRRVLPRAVLSGSKSEPPSGQALSSQPEEAHLSTGATVEQLELEGCRLRYAKLSGNERNAK